MRAILDRFNDSRFIDDDCPFPSHIDIQASPVVVVTGANATGKSLAFRHLAAFANDEGMPAITLSIRERTGAGMGGMAGMAKAMIYGDETEQSTGATSVNVTARGFKNVFARLEQSPPTHSPLMLDEPEIGLSEGYTVALGEWLAQQVLALPCEAPGLIVVTHSRSLVSGLVNGLERPPSFIHMGSVPVSLDQWLIAPEPRSVDDLLALGELGRMGRRAWSCWINSRPEKKD